MPLLVGSENILHPIFIVFEGMASEYFCDAEVNLCYSSPCGGNGTCIQQEGGYQCVCTDGFTGVVDLFIYNYIYVYIYIY